MGRRGKHPRSTGRSDRPVFINAIIVSMIIYARVLLRCMLWALPAASPLLSAQTPADPDLYIPPVLSLHITESFPARDTLAPKQIDLVADVTGWATHLLPMIFFDQGSSVIPERYVRFTGSGATQEYSERADVITTVTFDRNLYSSRDDSPSTSYDLEIGEATEHFSDKYYEILNVLGDRLRRHPATTITVRGEYSGEPGEEERIAAERAAVVREYLVGIWGIAPERITIMPPRRGAGPQENPFRQQEARRVVIASQSWEIHRPVLFRHVRLTQPTLFIDAALDTKVDAAEIAGVDLVATADGQVIATGSLPTNAASTQRWGSIAWSIPRAYENLPHTILFHATLRLTDGSLRRSNSIAFPIVNHAQTWGDEEWERLDSLTAIYPIPFFASGDTTLDALGRLMLENLLPPLRQRLLDKGDRRLIISFLPHSEEGEYPDADPTAMRFLLDTMSLRFERTWEAFGAIPSANSFSHVPRGTYMDMYEYRRLTTWNLYRIDYDAYRAFDSGLAAEMRRSRPSDADHDRLVHTLMGARADAVIALLRGRIDSGLGVRLGSPSLGLSRMTILQPLPERRFYRRHVALRLSTDHFYLSPESLHRLKDAAAESSTGADSP